MTMRTWLAVLACASLLACQAEKVATAPRASAIATTAASATPAVPMASTGATAAATSTAPASPQAPAAGAADVLVPPSGGFTKLAGTVQLDASYLISAGGGNIISAGAGNIISAGAGNVVASGGGNIISAGAGNVIAQGAGNIVSHNGSALAAANGAGLVSAGAGNYRLMAADVVPKAQQELAAAGVAVAVRDLQTGKAVALGLDGAGQPVYEVYTNLAGRYEVYLPAGLANNVLVVARVPGQDDPRMANDQLRAPLEAKEAVADEGSALSTRFLVDTYEGRVSALIGRILDFEKHKPTDPAAFSAARQEDTHQILAALMHVPSYDQVPDSVKRNGNPALEHLRTLMTDPSLGLVQADDKDGGARALATHRLAEFMLAHVAIASVCDVPVAQFLSPDGTDAPPSACPVDGHLAAFADLQDVFSRLQKQANTLLGDGSVRAAFLDAPIFTSHHAQILKASDVPAFIVNTFLAGVEYDLSGASEAITALGFGDDSASVIPTEALAGDAGYGYALYQLLLDDAITSAAIAAVGQSLK